MVFTELSPDVTLGYCPKSVLSEYREFSVTEYILKCIQKKWLSRARAKGGGSRQMGSDC